ncbi:MAG: Spy/CpxP family protein refolding chaperone [Rhodovibrionaceae bacterium]
MKRRLPWILFALSLILNVALVGGAVYVKSMAHHYRDHPDARAEYLSDELELDAGQESALMELMQSMSAAKNERQGEREEFRERFLAMLAQPELTRADIARELESGTGDWIARFSDKMMQMHDFVQTLTPEQREELFALAREKRGGISRLFEGKR